MSTLRKGIRVIVLESSVSTVSTGDIGIIEGTYMGGYGIYFPACRFVKLFGGGAGRRESIVWFEKFKVRRVTTKDIARLSDEIHEKKLKGEDTSKEEVYLEQACNLTLPSQLPEKPPLCGVTKNKSAVMTSS